MVYSGECFIVCLRRVCILILLGEAFYRCQLNRVRVVQVFYFQILLISLCIIESGDIIFELSISLFNSVF